MVQAGRLLVVDDEAVNRNLLARRLEQSGFEVEVAESGEAALGALQSQDVDLVLLDTMMPGMSGIEVLKLLRAVHTADQLPVIMVTGVSDSEKVAHALDLGANDYVTKPLDYAVALARIRSQLSRKQAEQALRQSEERYALAARGANDGLWDWDLVGGRIFFSTRWKGMLGYQEAEIGENPEEWFSRVHPDDRASLKQALEKHWSNPRPGGTFEHEHRMLHRGGGYRWMLSRGLAARDSSGRPARMAGSQSDITSLKVFDPLTGLPNRLLFVERVQQALEKARRGGRFAVLFLDLDRFKVVNDSLGHLLGDQLLTAVGERLRRRIRGAATASDIDGNHVVARLGGDEFAVLLDDIRDSADACRVADRLLAAMRPLFTVGGREVFCSASIGIAMSEVSYQTAEEIVRDADTAMYTAKSRGKSQWAVFDSAMRERALDRLQMEYDLRRALERDEFVIQYQPKVHLHTGEIRGFEALLRWRHPARGLLMPDDFISLAEETGLICTLGLWVLRGACQQARRWQQMDPQERPVEISVNVSARQFRQPDLVEQVACALEDSGLPAASLELEITETVLLEDIDSAMEVLKRLKALGVSLKVDDFGTGYSCLRYLCKLPFNSLKIDRSFTMALVGEDPKSTEIVRTILVMAHALGMAVVAEGVEAPDQARRLQELGCEFGQGFYFSKPVPATEARELLAGRAVARAAAAPGSRIASSSAPSEP